MKASSELLSILSLLVALVAATAGPVITWLVARLQLRLQREQFTTQSQQLREQIAEQRRQSKQQVISPMRQAWINALRGSVAETLSQASLFHLRHEPPTSGDREQLAAREAKLELLLNPGEDDHRDLLAAVRFVVNSIGTGAREFHVGHRKAVELAQKVLKQEWEVTKRGEF